MEIKDSYKPFDLVTDEYGNVGIITEVYVNKCQSPTDISYSVNWLIVKRQNKSAWFNPSELTSHCNLFVKIAESACHPFGGNKVFVKDFF